MTDCGLVSIITPNYNCGRYIAETVESVLAQTYSHWELLIQDDCSTDDSVAVAERYAARDPRIRIEVNAHRCGAALTRNRALARAQGRWIAFLDSDDLWMPRKLELQTAFMAGNGYAFAYHEYVEIDQDGRERGVRVSGKKRVGRFGMHACCWPGCLTVMYDAAKIGLVQIRSVKKNNDTALWLKVIRKSDCYLLKENLGRYRRRVGSVTPPGLWARVLWHYPLFREAEQMGPLRALFWTLANVPGNLCKKLFYVKRYNQLKNTTDCI